jgi:type I restriction enzyme R subunit
MLFEQGELGTYEQFIKAYGERPLGRFIRSIVGLDQSAANAAFSRFINNPALNPAQIRFVNLIIQSLTTNGVVEVEHLFSPPFTEISGHGLLGVFNQDEAEEVVTVLNAIDNTAVAV